MKVAVIGSRTLSVNNLAKYLPPETEEIVSGGARGIDTCAKRFALESGIRLKEFLPDYDKYQRAAPIMRNRQIVEYADQVVAFWDGRSHGTKFVVEYCQRIGKKVTVYIVGQATDDAD